jgi:hypothetical protein
MFDQKLDGAVVDWLEEIPLDELPTDYARMIVNDFREGHMEVTEAIALLNEDCDDLLRDYVKQNMEFESLLEDLELE